MKQKLYLSGIIIKYEKLVQISLHASDNIYIAEATNPYAQTTTVIFRKWPNPIQSFYSQKTFIFLNNWFVILQVWKNACLNM
ncbi:MAG TPA: hypothetical protein VEP89_07695 [Draconibacterium sp.]|nr:hypothetical protein [Draconibacterium sp.]